MVCGVTVLTGWLVQAETGQPLPTPFPEARYQEMSAKSPFAVATATAEATAAPTPGFAAQLYVDGIAHVGNTDLVAIKTRSPEEGKPAVVVVEVGKTTDDGIRADQVHWSDEMGKSTVDVSKAGEKATLAFDEATVKSAPAAAPGPAPMQMPRMPGQVRPGNVVGSGPFQPQGGVFNRIRSFPQQQGNMMGRPNGPGAGGIEVRRRRVIQSGQ